jgi:hypothetical protein
MSQKEMVSIIADMKGVHLRTAENHYDHLICTEKLSQLKNNGHVIRAQPTTANPTAITTEKLLHTYNIQLEAWTIQNKLNGCDESKMTPEELVMHLKVRDAHT